MLEGILLLLSDTPRSIQYVNALIKNELKLGAVLIYGVANEGEYKHKETHVIHEPIKRNRKSIADYTLEIASITDNVKTISQNDVNKIDLNRIFQGYKFELVVYSGYGGQILSEDLLEKLPPVLHMHAGSLPEYRGSTTVYYEMLEKKHCAVTAIILKPEIDTGDIIDAKVYPLPTSRIDIDFCFEPYCRASLLCDVLRRIESSGVSSILACAKPNQAKYQPYYVIHPILKNICIEGLFQG